MAHALRPLASLVLFATCAAAASAQTPAPTPPPGDSFYARSLHATGRGIEFAYSKEQGGLERITGLPASEVGCVKAKCHATSCDACHRKDANGKASYTLDPAVAQAACEGCHGAPQKDDPDVHARKGMKCMSCHSTREVHGDGVAYDTYALPGVLDTRCENCHSEIAKSASHTIHGGRVACAACHSREPDTCLNCHVEGRMRGEKNPEITLKGILFLANHNGRVTTANLLTYVYRNRTMITLGPSFGHSIAERGRACADCHDTANVRAVAGGSFTLATWAGGTAAGARGVVPVVDPLAWRIPFLDRKDGVWTLLAAPQPPLLHYSGNCGPLTEGQLASLAKPQHVR